MLSFTIRDAASMLDSLPEDQLGKTVLFISLQPHCREPRLAEAARLAGWRPVLIYSSQPKYVLNGTFELYARVPNVFGLILAGWLFRGAIVHVFALAGDLAYPLCAAKSHPTVLDLHDTCSGLAWAAGRQKRLEQEAIRRADGMTHRDLRIQFLHKLRGYRLPEHNALVLDPLPQLPPPPPVNSEGGEIHVVSVGWVGSMDLPDDNSIIRTARAICAAGIHLHVLVNPFQDSTGANMEGFRKIEQCSPYFHLMQSLYGDAYWRFLSRCDFGLAVFEPYIFHEKPRSYTSDYLQGCGSSRLADYIHAGLGVIMSSGIRFQWFLARRYAPVVVVATQEFLKNPGPVLQAALKEKALVGRKNVAAITTRGVARRLCALYEQVVSGTTDSPVGSRK